MQIARPDSKAAPFGSSLMLLKEFAIEGLVTVLPEVVGGCKRKVYSLTVEEIRRTELPLRHKEKLLPICSWL